MKCIARFLVLDKFVEGRTVRGGEGCCNCIDVVAMCIARQSPDEVSLLAYRRYG